MDSETVDEIKRHFGVVAEGLRDEIRAVAEGQLALREGLTARIDSLEHETRTEFAEVKSMIRLATVPAPRATQGPDSTD